MYTFCATESSSWGVWCFCSWWLWPALKSSSAVNGPEYWNIKGWMATMAKAWPPVSTSLSVCRYCIWSRKQQCTQVLSMTPAYSIHVTFTFCTYTYTINLQNMSYQSIYCDVRNFSVFFTPFKVSHWFPFMLIQYGNQLADSDSCLNCVIDQREHQVSIIFCCILMLSLLCDVIMRETVLKRKSSSFWEISLFTFLPTVRHDWYHSHVCR